MKKALLGLVWVFLSIPVLPQYVISGTVIDSRQKPLPGANILLAPGNRGTVSARDGSFSFQEVPAGQFRLLVSFIGYRTDTLELPVSGNIALPPVVLKPSPVPGEEVVVRALRMGEDAPVSGTTLTAEELSRNNYGQDIPYLLSMTPSVVVSSDAGNGIGYTGMRIRGTDGNRINVTINGVPLNDAESHSVYWVDLPDFASSVENVQIQRGVGSSTNGSAAFGASLNFRTLATERDPWVLISGNAGSFNTRRTSVSAGTGILKNGLSVDMRLSGLHSDGFIDRARTDLASWYLAGGYTGEHTSVKLIAFSGTEELYQAWDGVPSGMLDTAGTYNPLGEYTTTAGKTAYYDNQIDHYRQDHYQLLATHSFSSSLSASGVLFWTRGSGYYEEYKSGQSYAAYQLPEPVFGSDTIRETDLIRRKWLDNDFYGITASLNYLRNSLEVVAGGGWNRYLGDHFGTIIWAAVPGAAEINHRWYEGTGDKSDWNTYVKALYPAGKLVFYADLQLRGIHYAISGTDDDLRDISREHDYLFFNPKGGISFKIQDKEKLYLSVAIAHREPNRSNFTDADPLGPEPKPEKLTDLEFGYTMTANSFTLNAGLYAMYYRDQLVLTGEINDVGSAIMTNVDRSYRAGLELALTWQLSRRFSWEGNLTLSRNRILDYTGYVDNWSYWDDPLNEPYQVEENLGETSLAFSPSVTGNSRLSYIPFKGLTVSALGKYVGSQYIDNTSSLERMLDPYFTCDLGIDWSVPVSFARELVFTLALRNIFNEQYSSSAWVYRYYYGGSEYRMDGFYPQAGRNMMAGIKVLF
ncbi:MAG: TonB-dependent receptor [Bacteroidota bacterium]